MKIRFIHKRWFTPPFGSDGITLYPFIFIRAEEDTETLRRHELIHCWQIQRLGWWRFYFVYLIDEAFRNYVEGDAYGNQNDRSYLPTHLERLV